MPKTLEVDSRDTAKITKSKIKQMHMAVEPRLVFAGQELHGHIVKMLALATQCIFSSWLPHLCFETVVSAGTE